MRFVFHCGLLLSITKRLESLLAAQRVALGDRYVFTHHLRHQLLERGFRTPAEFDVRGCRIAEQRMHFGRPEITRVDAYDRLTNMQPIARPRKRGDARGFVDAEAFPLEDRKSVV